MKEYIFDYTVSNPEHLVGKTFKYVVDAQSEEDAINLFKGYISRCRDCNKEKLVLKNYSIKSD